MKFLFNYKIFIALIKGLSMMLKVFINHVIVRLPRPCFSVISEFICKSVYQLKVLH